MNRAELDSFDREGLIGFALAQAEAIERLTVEAASLRAANAEFRAVIDDLRAKLDRPPKTPDNSSLPPSRGQKKTTEFFKGPQEEGASGRASSAPSRPHASARCAGERVRTVRRRRLAEPAGALRSL
jgi:hypothetical protein